MLIGILQTGHAPAELINTYGDYNDLFSIMLHDRQLEFANYPVVDGTLPPHAKAADGWLITGSRHGVYESHFWLPPLENLIREIHAAELPLVGVCFGHQVIAQALGGCVAKHGGGWVVGPNLYWRSDLLVEQMMLAWHQDQVVVKPSVAETVGSSQGCEHAVLKYGATTLTYQFHPEFKSAFVKDLFALRGSSFSEELKSNVASASDAELSTKAVVTEIKRLFLTFANRR